MHGQIPVKLVLAGTPKSGDKFQPIWWASLGKASWLERGWPV